MIHSWSNNHRNGGFYGKQLILVMHVKPADRPKQFGNRLFASLIVE